MILFTKKNVVISVLLMFIMIFLFTACGKADNNDNQHDGEVYIYDGYGWTWYEPVSGVRLNQFSQMMFEDQGGFPIYTGNEYSVIHGIDVSEHQKVIDWNSVSSSNIDFAYIRLGRRGYTEGGLFLDEKFKENIHGALSSGIKTGVYFFSQAITAAEAIEEADFLLENLQGLSVDLPIVYDWERIDDQAARTKDISVSSLTDCAVAFCETVKNAGYEPCIYYNRTVAYHGYDLSRLTNYKVWFALPYTPPEITWPSFLYHIDMWQYSTAGNVPGIDGETDMDFIFYPQKNINNGMITNS